MGYYSGIIEHDTGMHADADQQVAGQSMTVSYTHLTLPTNSLV